MRILLINGSPKGDKSNSLQLAKAFIEGICQAKDARAEQVNLSSLQLSPCKGCFACWNKTPGQCAIRDDMAALLEKMRLADVILYSFPLYYFGVPGILKNFIDRQLPIVLPFMTERTDGVGSGGHQTRYDVSNKKYMLVSTCGFYSAKGNYDSVCRMFDHMYGKNSYDTLFCGQGELFRVKELRERTGAYLETVKKAGTEWAQGGISKETREELDALLYPKEVFEQMADASWGVDKESGEKEDESLSFTRQMAALYNKNSWDGKNRVLEICYTDLQKTYQIALEKEGSRVVTDGSLTPTTRIDTPFDVWLQIAQGEIRGDVALAKQMYRVSGDFSLMIQWDTFFGSGETKEEKPTPVKKDKKKPQLWIFLLPFMAFWILGGNGENALFASLAFICAVPLLSLLFRFTRYDTMAISGVSILSATTLFTGQLTLCTNLSFLFFGLLWLVSAFTKEPLCAAYVKYNYGGDDALENPLFMKTNVILAAGWGVLYLLIAVAYFLLGNTPLGAHIPTAQYILTALMGIFTGWFEKWYPAHLAAGGK